MSDSDGAIREWLLAFLAARDTSGPPPTDDEDLFTSGRLDSLGVVAMITALEQRFGVRFSEDDLEDARFARVSGVVEIVREARARDA